ncbi:ornithine cyclodeaminase family protein [Sphingomonas sp. ERG5]|uniref:ornithine cyclodeaminase family protein n=1 Tax=Sphingomonas sp. ERG5 TaxID=1381597 RepID=UPI00054B1AE5|nr:ornithine cyclodeaminase family protein [Sphingomonas sp. ERG5]
MISAQDVARDLSYEVCIPLMRKTMIALSEGRTRQLLRGIIDLPGDRAFGVMPGLLLESGAFGAKLVSVYPDNFSAGKPSHQGVIVLFDPDSGAPVCIVDAGEVTAIRTAAASAAATDILATPDAGHLAVLGYGEQAWRHIEAIRHIRRLERVTIWGRSPQRADALVRRVQATGIDATAASDVAAAVADADIICTVTAASEPVLMDRWVRAGTHINAVGSSRAGPREIDDALVARSRFFADHGVGVLAQGAEFLHAKEAGLIDDDHLLGEIGEVMTGATTGRVTDNDITLYKSLGSIVQDLACAWHLYSRRKTPDGVPLEDSK